MRRNDRIRLAILCGVLVVGCDATDPAPAAPAVPRYGLVLTSPKADATVSDALVEGFVRSPAEGNVIIVTWNVGNQTGTVHSVYRDPPDLALDSVPFSFTLTLPAGTHVIEFFVKYSLNVQNAVVDEFVKRTFRVYRKPTYRIDAGMADTLFQRSLMLDVSQVDGITPPWYANLVIDPGTPNEKLIDNSTPASVDRPWTETLSSTSRRLYYPDTLAPGQHQVRIRFYEDSQQTDSITRTFSIQLPTVFYTVTPLPGFGGVDARAVALNEKGEAAGWALDASGRKRAVLWRDGAVQALDTATSAAFAITTDGVVFGTVTDTATCAARWDTSGRTILKYADGSCIRNAVDANNAGSILVVSPTPSRTALVVRADGTVLEKNLGSCEIWLKVPYLNDLEHIAGQKHDCYHSRPGFVGFSPQLPLSFAQGSPHWWGEATGLNNSGSYIGYQYAPIHGASKQFTGRLGEPPTILSGALSIRNAPDFVAVNDDGVVLGMSSNRGYLWRAGRVTQFTVPSPWTIDAAHAMNNARQIIAHATQPSGQKAAILLTPQ